jgi:hypothetical protein
MFRRVELAALRRYHELGELDAEPSVRSKVVAGRSDGESGWTAAKWESAIEDYFDEYDEIGTGPSARGPAFLHIDAGLAAWTVRQVFEDPAGDHDWGIDATVDLAASDEAGAASVVVTAVGPH